MKRMMSWMMILTIWTACAVTASPAADILNVGQGSMRVLSGDGDPEVLDLPLKHTSVEAFISGYVARVTVIQQFSNDQDHALEAVYVFPLPDNAAVDAMTLHIGDRVIKGVIKKREEARRIYEQARQEGRTAALLDQERPNIFTQSVANILPGDDIRVEISYVQNLKYDEGGYEFNFPMVVGPRFIPGSPIGHKGGGWAPDTDTVPDASRITPPVLRPNERSGHDIDLTVFLDAGLAIRGIRSPSHRIDVRTLSDTEAEIHLDPADTIPNKDFILRYDVAGPLPEAALLAHAGEKGRFFTLMIQPQASFDMDEVTPKEMIFVVDCSGSMSGAPIAQAKAAMKKCIAEMNPEDSFQIIRFSSSASKFSPVPLPNTPANVQKGLRYVDAMSGSGGTMMIEGIKAALNYPPDPKRMRIVLFMTDGYIGNEREILAAIKKYLGGARLFSFGVGTSVNHYLLDRMAEVGRGFVQYVRPDEDTTDAVDRFYRRIRNPLLTDIRIDWNGLDVKDVYPAVIPDLFDAQPVILHGRYGSPGKGTVVLHGRIHGRPWKQTVQVDLPAEEPDHDALASLWARARIKALMSRMYGAERPDIVKEITDLALRFRLMSRYTSFVAVSEDVRRAPDGGLETIQVPVPMPEQVSYEGCFGKADAKELMALGYLGGGITARAPVRKSKGWEAFGRSVQYEALDEISDADVPNNVPPMVSADEKKAGHHAEPVVRVRSVSGTAAESDVREAFDDIYEDLMDRMRQYGFRKAVLRIDTDEDGAVMRVEWLDVEGGSGTGEVRLTTFLQTNLELKTGKASFTVEITL